MSLLTLHHYGFLTSKASDWLEENEKLLGKPYKVFRTVHVSSQKVSVTFVEQNAGDVLIELVEPDADNISLQKMISKGIGIYHAGFTVAADHFDHAIAELEQNGARSLQTIFNSEAFNQQRCVFLLTSHLGLIELIEK